MRRGIGNASTVLSTTAARRRWGSHKLQQPRLESLLHALSIRCAQSVFGIEPLLRPQHGIVV
jgi:hypothetical protein